MRIALVVLCVAVCGHASTADEKPDFTLKAEDYAKEYATDKKAFISKYNGKVVEVSATVWCVHLNRGMIFLNGYKKDAKEHIGQLVYASPPKYTLGEKQRVLAQGQEVTVRGKQMGEHPELTDAEFMKTGPSTALPVTVVGLAAEFKRDAKKAGEKYNHKSVLFQAKYVAPGEDDAWVRFHVTDPAGKSDLKIQVQAFPLIDGKMKDDLKKLKAGDVVLLMGTADALGTPFRIDDVFLLKEPPPGVKLPGDKK